jgi:hypothetical protein
MDRPPASEAERALIDCALGQPSSVPGEQLAGDVAQSADARAFAAGLAAVLQSLAPPDAVAVEAVAVEPVEVEPVAVEPVEVEPVEVEPVEVEPVALEPEAPEFEDPEVDPGERCEREGALVAVAGQRPSRVWSPRMTATLALGCASLLAGGVLFVNGGH